MNKFFKCGFSALALTVIPLSAMEESSNNKDADQTNSEEVEVIEAPNYSKLIPIKNWTRLSGDSATTLGEWKRWWTYLRMKKPVIMNWISGLKIRIYPKNEVFRALYVTGIYDPNVAVAINSLLPQKGVFIDVGANMGYLSMIASRTVGELGRVYALEPSKRDFLRLVDNINLNGLKNVYSYQLAILDADKKLEMNIAGEERSALNTFGKEFGYRGIEKLGTEMVQAVTIDGFVDTENIEKVDLIKLDIEGTELLALKGARDTIEKFRPAIILGLNKEAYIANGLDVEDIKNLLQELRYKAYVLAEVPFFAFKEVNNIAAIHARFVVCMHESIIPPVLPQFVIKTWQESVSEFFSR